MFEKSLPQADDKAMPPPPEARNTSIVWDEKGMRPGSKVVESTVQLTFLDVAGDSFETVQAD